MTDLEQLVAEAPREDLPRIIGQLAQAQAAATARLMVPVAAAAAQAVSKWLTPTEAAELARASKRQVYEWAVGKRWARRPSRRKLLIDEAGFLAWLGSRP